MSSTCIFVGFCVKFPNASPQASSEEDYYTADESETSEDTGETAETLSQDYPLHKNSYVICSDF